MLACATLALGACHTDNDDISGPTVCPPADAWSYSGQLDVTPTEGSPFSAFSEEAIVFELKRDGDDRYILKIPRIKFVEQMPVYIAFEVRDIELVDDEAGGFTFAIDETTPYRNGAPYDPNGKGTYTIRDLRGRSIDGSVLETSFDCYTMHVEYRGKRQ